MITKERLEEFEDFMEEQGFESLGELKKELGRQFEIKEDPFRYGQELNGVYFSNEQIMILNQFTEFSGNWLARYKNSETENQALKARWEMLKKYVQEELEKNKDLACTAWYNADEEFLAKMQELEKE